MRYSNYIFTKGSIVFVMFPASSEKAFLNGRPLIVVSNPSHLLHTLTVCTTGTQDKPGIAVSFWNHMDKCYIGDTEVSNIYPYNILTIRTDQIVASIGQLDPFIMKEVDKAIDFHLGRTDEVPGYLKEFEDHICGVGFNSVQEKYITSETVSENFTPPYKYKREHHKTSHSKSHHQSEKGNTQKTHSLTNDEIMQWTKEIPLKDIDIFKICKNPKELVSALDEKSVSLIVSRSVPISLICKKYNINIRTATYLRITLTNFSVKLGVSILNGETKPLSNTIPEYTLIGMILAKAFSPNMITSSESKYDRLIDMISEKYKINTEDKRIWKSVETFYCA